MYPYKAYKCEQGIKAVPWEETTLAFNGNNDLSKQIYELHKKYPRQKPLKTKDDIETRIQKKSKIEAQTQTENQIP